MSNAEIPRREPLKRLCRHPHARLIVVHGPAGFGKTTLLRQYCALREREGVRVAWLHMDSRATDPGHFLRLLCDAISDDKAVPKQGESSGGSVSEVVRLAGRLKKGATIVIDNFEQSNQAGVNAVFAQLVRALPPGVQVCLATRMIPAINLSRLQVTETAIVVKAEELRFTLSETIEFFKESRGMSAEEIEELHRCTDGWPAALQCYRLCLRNGRMRRGVALSSGGVTPELIDFLTTNVFESLPAEMQSLLLAACIPERICSDLMTHLAGGGSGKDLLEQIEQCGLFLSPLGLEGKWYRFHNVFRSFLMTRLKNSLAPEDLRRRHREVADWYISHSLDDEAILNYLQAGSHEAAAAVLARVIDRLVAEERLGLIVQCVDQIPGDILRQHENILHAAGIAYAFRRDFAKAAAVQVLLGEALEARGGNAESWGTYNFVRMFVLAAQDDIPKLGEVALETIGQLGKHHGFKYAVAFNARAYYLAAHSDFDGARAALMMARPLHDEAGSLFGQAYQEGISSTVLTAQGRLDESIRKLKAALRQVEDGRSSSVAAGTVIGAYLAAALYERNCVDEADALLNDYGQLVEQQAIVDPLAVSFITSARIACLRGRQDDAEETLERAIYLGHRHSLPRMVRYAHAELARRATLNGELAVAERHLHAMPEETAGDLLFQAGETEAHCITKIRYLIACGAHGEARAALQGQARKAKAQRRVRRLLKLNLLLAISLSAEGQTSAARRALISALELGQPSLFIRTFLDEGLPVVRLLKETLQGLPKIRDLPQRDVIETYLERLLAEAGEPVVAVPVVLDEWDEGEDGGVSAQLFEQLTDRERDILRLVAGGLPNKALADRLALSTNTVKWHMRNIFEKLHIANRMQAVVVARHYGLIE